MKYAGLAFGVLLSVYCLLIIIALGTSCRTLFP